MEISSEYSLEGLMLKLKLQYFGHLMRRTDSLEKTMILGKTETGGKGNDRGWDGWMASQTQWTWVWVVSRIWWWTGKPGVLQPMGWQRVGHDWATELIWTQLILVCVWFTCKCVHMYIDRFEKNVITFLYLNEKFLFAYAHKFTF